ncbi:cbb3-type cytochrome oxidase assembly protein CcoS [uncultured Methylophaga sp.]|uniref:cbb3-type cytochrome oxidase assembly protein CcoS n=1 Tax=uncultured Methylophaga sp. TaxID=285271 RepID=UPI002630FBD5|nr:cbb3-type cytochrome oxidase assembly protein CcoS [uncultured Methylophaga sp.]
MEVIYGLLPGMLLLGIIGVAVFFWAVRNGQYDDMDGAAHRVLLDDDELPEQHTDESDSEADPDHSSTTSKS